jgi:hypothetical protein
MGALTDLARVLAAAPAVERWRRRSGLEAAVGRAREAGSRLPSRDEAARGRLRRLVAAVDRAFPGGANCYRRTLLLMAVDPDLARQRFMVGLDLGQTADGHAWLGDERGRDRPYDVEFGL